MFLIECNGNFMLYLAHNPKALHYVFSSITTLEVEKARFMQTDGKMLMEICYEEPGSCLSYCSFLLFLTHPVYLFSLSAADLQEPPEPRGFLKLLVNQEKAQPFSGVGGSWESINALSLTGMV